MRTFSERSNEKVVVVGEIFSNLHPLSNYYSASYVFKQQKYSSVEQGFQHIKALISVDQATSADILSSNDPAVTKRSSYNISGFNQDVWTTKRHELKVADCENQIPSKS